MLMQFKLLLKNEEHPLQKIILLKLRRRPRSIIKTNGAHIRYQVYIWYLHNALKKSNEYLYHFSKWMLSFLLKNKEANLVLSKIKAFISMNGPPKIFHTTLAMKKNLKIWK